MKLQALDKDKKRAFFDVTRFSKVSVQITTPTGEIFLLIGDQLESAIRERRCSVCDWRGYSPDIEYQPEREVTHNGAGIVQKDTMPAHDIWVCPNCHSNHSIEQRR